MKPIRHDSVVDHAVKIGKTPDMDSLLAIARKKVPGSNRVVIESLAESIYKHGAVGSFNRSLFEV